MTTSTAADSLSCYVDSGCIDHMTRTNAFFYVYIDISYEKRIVQGVGSITLEVMGVGDINVQVHLGKREEFATLTDVLFVPRLDTRLFPLQRATQKNVDKIMSKHSC